MSVYCLSVSPRNVSRCCRPHRRRARARRRRPPSPTAAAAKSPPPFNQRRGGGRRSLVPKKLPSRNNTLQPQIPRRKVARCSPLLSRRSPGTLPLCRPAPLPGAHGCRPAARAVVWAWEVGAVGRGVQRLLQGTHTQPGNQMLGRPVPARSRVALPPPCAGRAAAPPSTCARCSSPATGR